MELPPAEQPPLRLPVPDDRQPHLPAREPAPRQPVPQQPAQRPPRRVPAIEPPQVSSATAWWIAAGVIVVALAVAAGILVGLSLARR
ncbi:hypothetical protein OHA72_01955 [Dactylosporangium sp. NBC_01737]|uniref:hypothetical protein n=1 Tax=Dactylosporangium sp. NBC_01737 TaxID=2975959 RepID=UPI002E13BE2C|nr:hypothetical protein OHA72_01955 [Dactylosporangium sp. NBC_01737]